jgi:hypothetical protein
LTFSTHFELLYPSIYLSIYSIYNALDPNVLDKIISMRDLHICIHELFFSICGFAASRTTSCAIYSQSICGKLICNTSGSNDNVITGQFREYQDLYGGDKPDKQILNISKGGTNYCIF